MPYASDKNAYGISDRSGFRYRLKDMRVEWTGAKVGKDEFETKHPQLFPPRVGPDPQALKNPRPESIFREQRNFNTALTLSVVMGMESFNTQYFYS